MTDAPEWLCLGQDMHGFWSTSAVDMDAARYTRTDLADAAERAAYLRGLEDAGAAIRNACNCDLALDAIRALAKEKRK